LEAPVLPAKEAEDATKDQDGHPEEAREDGQGGVDFLKLTIKLSDRVKGAGIVIPLNG